MDKIASMQRAKYLVCMDSREESRAGLRLACLKANARGSSVILLHIIPPADFQTLGAVANRMREEQRQEGQKLLDGLADTAHATYGVRPTCLLREGPLGDEIVTTAESDPDIITVVLGIAQQSTGRGKLASWLAAQLGGKLLTPLLMVPGNLTDEELQKLI